MADSIKCPKCNSELSESSKFCDQCGAPRDGSASPAASDTPQAKAGSSNWLGLIIVVVLLGVGWWMFFGPREPAAPVPAGGGGGMTNPHGGDAGGGMTNPHGGDTGGAMTNPHGGDAGGGMGMGGDSGNMDNLMENLATAKTTLEEDPLHVESMQILYQSYGMIGRSAQLEPYITAAKEELVARSEAGEDAAALSDIGKGIAIAAVAWDPPAAVDVIETMQGIWPEDKVLEAMIGDLYASSGMMDEGLASYDAYLANDPPMDEMYWSVRIKRANALAMKHEAAEGGDQASLDAAIAELQSITLENTESFQGWYSLGMAFNLSGQKQKAISSWKNAIQNAGDGMERWAAESEIAKAEGREAPARPGPDGMAGMQGM